MSSPIYSMELVLASLLSPSRLPPLSLYLLPAARCPLCRVGQPANQQGCGVLVYLRPCQPCHVGAAGTSPSVSCLKLCDRV